VFVVMCDTSVRTPAVLRAVRCTNELVLQLEAGPVVKCAWRVKAAADGDDADAQRSILSLPTALLAQKAGLEFVFFVWGASTGAAAPPSLL
jgi:hypothetical protein